MRALCLAVLCTACGPVRTWVIEGDTAAVESGPDGLITDSTEVEQNDFGSGGDASDLYSAPTVVAALTGDGVLDAERGDVLDCYALPPVAANSDIGVYIEVPEDFAGTVVQLQISEGQTGDGNFASGTFTMASRRAAFSTSFQSDTTDAAVCVYAGDPSDDSTLWASAYHLEMFVASPP